MLLNHRPHLKYYFHIRRNQPPHRQSHNAIRLQILKEKDNKKVADVFAIAAKEPYDRDVENDRQQPRFYQVELVSLVHVS